jgi:hypothetical protein
MSALPYDPVRVGRQLSIRLLEQEVLAYPLLIKPDKCSAMTRVIDLDRHRRQAERGDRLSARQVQRAGERADCAERQQRRGRKPKRDERAEEMITDMRAGTVQP